MKSNKYLIALLLLLIAAQGFSQSAPEAPAASDASTFDLPNVMAWVLGIASAILFIVAMVYIIKVNQFLYKRVLQMEAQKSGVLLPSDAIPVTPVGDDFWTRLRKKYWEDAVPIEREADIMLQHPHDGIYELDNRLPPWWINMFFLTIIWAVGYMYYYHWGGNGVSQKEEYQQEMETAKKQIAVALAGKANAIDESNVTLVSESGALGEGELIFKNSCAACHGQLGEGGVGPNFTDDNWIHGGGIKNLFKVIKYGVPEKGMISWQSQLKPADMQKVASYILTLRGTNPPNPKDPQGPIWTGEAAADTTATTTPEPGK
jgi:cytochrome c oxidase cbb3-type subunit III